MRIEITRSGGFAGLTRTWSLEVSRTEAEQRWLPLAEAEAGGAEAGGAEAGGAETGGSGAGGSGAESGPGAQRDRFTYRIAIGYTEVHLPEGRLDDPWRELIERARATATASAAPSGSGVEGSGVEGSGAGAAPEGTGGTDVRGQDPGSTPSSDTDPGNSEELL